jgi:hypothetical protein
MALGAVAIPGAAWLRVTGSWSQPEATGVLLVSPL